MSRCRHATVLLTMVITFLVRLPAQTIVGAWVCLENRSDYTWQRHHPEGKRVDLIIRCDGTVLATHLMPRAEVHPGERVTVHFPLHLPCGG